MTETAPVRDRAAIEANLDEAERAYQSDDPYRKAAGYDLAGRLYTELACHVDDRTLAAACMQAGQHYQVLAAQTRFTHRIPTLFPRREATLLGLLGRCVACGRGWSLDPGGACPHCPRLLYGPTPDSAQHAAGLPRPQRALLDGEHDE